MQSANLTDAHLEPAAPSPHSTPEAMTCGNTCTDAAAPQQDAPIDAAQVTREQILQTLRAVEKTQSGFKPIQETPKQTPSNLAMADLRGTNLTRTNLTAADLTKAKMSVSTECESTVISNAIFTNVEFTALALPPKRAPREPPRASFWVRRVGTAALEAALADEDDANKEDEEDEEGKEEVHEEDSLADKVLEKLGSEAATVMQRAYPVIIKAKETLTEVIVAAKKDLESSDGLAAELNAVVTAADSETATALVTQMLNKEVCSLLDKLAKELELAGSDKAPNDVGTLALVTELAIDPLIREVRLLVERRAESLVRADAGCIAEAVRDEAKAASRRRASFRRRSTLRHDRDQAPSDVESGLLDTESGQLDGAPASSPLNHSVSFRLFGRAMGRLAAWTPSAVYRRELKRILESLNACIKEEPDDLLRHCAIHIGAKMLCRAGFDRRVKTLGKHARALEEKMLSRLEKDSKNLKTQLGEQLGEQLDRRVRLAAAAKAMAATSSFAMRTWGQMVRLVTRTRPVDLVKYEKELVYLLDELKNVKGTDITASGWLDFYESWQVTTVRAAAAWHTMAAAAAVLAAAADTAFRSSQAVLALRTKQQGECAQQVIDAIVTDESLLCGLGAAHTLRDAIYEGNPPQELLQQLKQGPGKHIKVHAYEYQRKIDKELAQISRIQTLQQRAVGLAGTLVFSTAVGVANFVSRTVYDAVNSA